MYNKIINSLIYVGNKEYAAIYSPSVVLNANDATRRNLRQTFVLSPATQVAVDKSVEQPTINFTNVMKTNAYV